jgi:hypothetical protein
MTENNIGAHHGYCSSLPWLEGKELRRLAKGQNCPKQVAVAALQQQMQRTLMQGNYGHHGSRANRHGAKCTATQGKGAIPLGGWAEMPEGYVQEVDEDQDNDDDKDSKITDQTSDLRRLEQYQ